MADVSTSLRNDMINSAVNAMFQNVGADRIKASKAAGRIADENGDGWISKPELKHALENDKVVLSLKEHNDGSFGRAVNALDIASDVSSRMDAADGRRDSYVDFSNKNGSDLFERLGAAFGNVTNGIYTSDLTHKLAEGDLVIGRQIRDRMNAKQKGFDIIELHQNKDGPKLVNGQ